MNNSIIITTYFSQKHHPNDPNDPWVVGKADDGRVLQNDIKYIYPWYNSITKLGLKGIIFYDNLTTDFINTYQNNQIEFIKVSPSDYSNNDWRFFVYRNFLQNHHYDSVFLTDGSDVTVVQDPSKIVQEYPDIDLFVCKDSIKLCQFGYLNIHKEARWDNYSWFAMQHLQRKLDLINMGVIGGTYNNIMDFLDKFCLTRLKLGTPSFNADMWIGQYIIRHLMSKKQILIGHPFTSEFKQYQNSRKDVYFIHK
jgi:hypothetical protein